MGAASESTALISPDAVATVARRAYEGQDVDASRQYHEQRDSSEELHQKAGGLLKPMIFGGLDGILTSFAIVAGAAGGKLPTNVVLILGFSNIIADALSMGVGEFLSSKAENEWILSERKREVWELENFPEGEIKEMVEIYEQRGMSHKDADVVVRTMAKYKEFFVDVMMTQELELQVPEKDHVQESLREGLVMFCSFSFFGALPLIGYVFFPLMFPHMNEHDLFISACGVTACVLFLLGSVKSGFSTSNWFVSGMETLLLGGLCASVAYSIGKWIETYAS